MMKMTVKEKVFLDNFALDLSSLIIHLEYQRKRVLENPATSKKMCYCRTLILNNYVSSLQKFLIRISARTLKFFDDYNYAITTDTRDIRAWFFSEVYDSLFENPNISNKMILMFRQVQENLDEKFFDIIDLQYRAIIQAHATCDGEDFGDILSELYADIRSWFEIFIYNILAIQLNCANISDEIFVDFGVEPDAKCCSDDSKDPKKCKNCPFTDCFKNCTVHEGVLKFGENIYLVVTPEIVTDVDWYHALFAKIAKYHKKPKQVRVEFDFRMFDTADKLYFTRQHLELFEKAAGLFGNVIAVNHKGVEFNLFLDKMRPFLKG